MAKTILIVEDDPNISELVQMYLEKEGYHTKIAADGGQGVALFRQVRPDLVLLDIMLPVMDGWSVLRTIRQDSQTPVIMLTAKGETNDKVQGLKQGADDYLTKPFEMKEVLARIEAVLRRSPERPRQLREIRIPGATLDSANRLITFKDGRETSLTAREFEFLTYMATHPNRVITRDELLRRVWDVDPRLTDTRSVEMTVMRLRDKLGAASASPLETLRSQGYRWNSSFVS